MTKYLRLITWLSFETTIMFIVSFFSFMAFFFACALELIDYPAISFFVPAVMLSLPFMVSKICQKVLRDKLKDSMPATWKVRISPYILRINQELYLVVHDHRALVMTLDCKEKDLFLLVEVAKRANCWKGFEVTGDLAA